jgi:hypothetical protein
MEILNLKKLWGVCNILSDKQDEFHEKDIYIYFMGRSSKYNRVSFENFLDYYCFRVEGDTIVVFNNEPIPYESWNTEDYSYIPINLLGFSDEELDDYIKIAVEKELERIEKKKISEKEDIKRQIEFLNKRLNNL